MFSRVIDNRGFCNRIPYLNGDFIESRNEFYRELASQLGSIVEHCNLQSIDFWLSSNTFQEITDIFVFSRTLFARSLVNFHSLQLLNGLTLSISHDLSPSLIG